MAAVGLRLRAELARRWRSWLSLALILGLVGGAVLALAAGARRTDSAYSRFLDAQNAYDVLLAKDTGDFGTEDPPGPPLDAVAIKALPGVKDVAVASRFFTTIGAGVGVLVSPDGRLGDKVNSLKILEGRRADPEHPAEVVVGFAFAEQYRVGVGDSIQLFDPAILDHPPPGMPPEILAKASLAGRRVLAALPGGNATVVGIEAAPGEFPPQIEGTGRYLINASPSLSGVVDDIIDFLAEKAEPSPGFRFDGTVVALGGLGLTASVIALSLWPSWVAARRSFATGPTGPSPGRPSHVGRMLAWFPAPLPAEIGVRMALEPGRGRAAVPVRSTLTAVTLGVAALADSLVFAASLGHLLSTPRLYGQTWDAELKTYDEAIVTKGLPALQADHRVAGIAVGRTREAFTIGGRRVDGLSIDSVKGGLTPSILEGRPPASDKELVVGTSSMHDFGLKVGDRVHIGAFAGGKRTVAMRVVGRAVFPVFGEAGQLGHGVYVTQRGGNRIDPKAINHSPSVLVGLAPGADLDRVTADLKALKALEGSSVVVLRQGKPTDIVNFGRVKQTPSLLGALLGAVSAVTLLQLLVTAPRRRRRDLAVLKSLGFVRRQLRGAIAWQAVTVLGVALLLGVPLGIAAGVSLWRRFADGLGVIAEPQVRPIAFMLLVVGGLSGALLIAILPARSAARTPAGIALRSE